MANVLDFLSRRNKGAINDPTGGSFFTDLVREIVGTVDLGFAAVRVETLAAATSTAVGQFATFTFPAVPDDETHEYFLLAMYASADAAAGKDVIVEVSYPGLGVDTIEAQIIKPRDYPINLTNFVNPEDDDRTAQINRPLKIYPGGVLVVRDAFAAAAASAPTVQAGRLVLPPPLERVFLGNGGIVAAVT